MKQAVTELCGGMGVEISEQDSEKLRKDAFHPGRDTSAERAARDAKNIPVVHLQNANRRRNAPQGPNLDSGEGCIKEAWEGAAAALCSWSSSWAGGLHLPPSTACPHCRLPLSPHPPLQASDGDPRLVSMQDLG